MCEKSCGAIIYRYHNKELEFLLLQQLAGHWSFPKGHVENQETETETAVREIKEETGLDVQLDTRFREVITYPVRGGHIKDVVYFVGKVIGGHEQAQVGEVQKLAWLSSKEALEKITFANTKWVFEQAVKYLECI